MAPYMARAEMPPLILTKSEMDRNANEKDLLIRLLSEDDEVAAELLERFVLYTLASTTPYDENQAIRRLAILQKKAEQDFLADPTGFSNSKELFRKRLIDQIPDELIRRQVISILDPSSADAMKLSNVDKLLGLAQAEIALAKLRENFGLQFSRHQNKLIQLLLSSKTGDLGTSLNQAKTFLERKERKMQGAYPTWFCDEVSATLEQLRNYIAAEAHRVQATCDVGPNESTGRVQKEQAVAEEALIKQKEEYEARLHDWEERHDRLAKDYTSLTKSHSEKVEDLDSKVHDLNSELVAEKTLSENRHAQITELEKSLNDQSSDLKSKESQITDLIAEHKTAIAKAENDRNSAMLARTEVETELKAVTTENEQQKSHLTTERDNARADLREAEAIASKSQSDLEAKQRDITDLETQLVGSNKSKDDVEARNASLEDKMTSLERQLEETRLMKVQLEDELRLNEEKARKFEAEVKSATLDVGRVTALYEEEKKAHDTTKAELLKANQSIEQHDDATAKGEQIIATSPNVGDDHKVEKPTVENLSSKVDDDHQLNTAEEDLQILPGHHSVHVESEDTTKKDLFADFESNADLYTEDMAGLSSLSVSQTAIDTQDPYTSHQDPSPTFTATRPTNVESEVKYLPEFTIESLLKKAGLAGECAKCGHEYYEEGHEEFRKRHEQQCNGTNPKVRITCGHCETEQFKNRLFFRVHVVHCEYKKYGKLCTICGFWIRKNGFWDEHVPACRKAQEATKAASGTQLFSSPSNSSVNNKFGATSGPTESAFKLSPTAPAFNFTAPVFSPNFSFGMPSKVSPSFPPTTMTSAGIQAIWDRKDQNKNGGVGSAGTFGLHGIPMQQMPVTAFKGPSQSSNPVKDETPHPPSQQPMKIFGLSQSQWAPAEKSLGTPTNSLQKDSIFAASQNAIPFVFTGTNTSTLPTTYQAGTLSTKPGLVPKLEGSKEPKPSMFQTMLPSPKTFSTNFFSVAPPQVSNSAIATKPENPFQSASDDFFRKSREAKANNGEADKSDQSLQEKNSDAEAWSEWSSDSSDGLDEAEDLSANASEGAVSDQHKAHAGDAPSKKQILLEKLLEEGTHVNIKNPSPLVTSSSVAIPGTHASLAEQKKLPEFQVTTLSGVSFGTEDKKTSGGVTGPSPASGSGSSVTELQLGEYTQGPSPPKKPSNESTVPKKGGLQGANPYADEKDSSPKTKTSNVSTAPKKFGLQGTNPYVDEKKPPPQNKTPDVSTAPKKGGLQGRNPYDD